MYIRLQRASLAPSDAEDASGASSASAGPAFGQLITANQTAELWMTSSILQGDGDGVYDCVQCGLSVVGRAAVFVGGALQS